MILKKDNYANTVRTTTGDTTIETGEIGQTTE
jgi:hypothetical protein